MEHSPEKEKRKNDPLRSSRPMLFVLLTMAGIVLFIAHYSELVRQASEFEQRFTGIDAWARMDYWMIRGLPRDAQNIEYIETTWAEAVRARTARFSLPPEAYVEFIAAAKPVDQAKCWLLPLQPEGIQPKKDRCTSENLTITIDKRNPALWRINFDIR